MRLKFRIKIVEKWRFSSWVALFISLCLIGTAAAYYTDREGGGLNGVSVPLDFILEASAWDPIADATDLDPGESVTKTIRVVDDASFSTPFKYGVKTVPTGGDLDFCAALQLEATMDGVPAYNGLLLDFDFWPVTFDPAGSLWTMRVSLPGGASVVDGQTCDFDFLYQGWQERFSIFPQGYHDEELVSDRLATGSAAPQCRLLNFETDAAGAPISAGQRIDSEYSAWGVTIAANNAHPNGNHPDWAIAFNSAAPTGGDPDLGTPNGDFGGPGVGAGGESGTPGENHQAQGKLLIISENKVDANLDGLVDVPDDEANGGQISFTFDEPSMIEELRLFDIEETGVTIKLYDVANVLLSTVNVPSLGDNSAQTLTLNQTGVKRLEVSFIGSGGLDDLCFKPSPPPPPPPTIGCSPGYWKNHQEVWFDANDPVDVAMLEDLLSRGHGSGLLRFNAAVALNGEFPAIAAQCGEDLLAGEDELEEETGGEPRGVIGSGTSTISSATSTVDLISTDELSVVETETASTTPDANTKVEAESADGGGDTSGAEVATPAEAATAVAPEPVTEPTEEPSESVDTEPEVEAEAPAEEAAAEPEPEPTP